MIKDRLVVRIRDNSLSERLQMDAELTLEKAMAKRSSAQTTNSCQWGRTD